MLIVFFSVLCIAFLSNSQNKLIISSLSYYVHKKSRMQKFTLERVVNIHTTLLYMFMRITIFSQLLVCIIHRRTNRRSTNRKFYVVKLEMWDAANKMESQKKQVKQSSLSISKTFFIIFSVKIWIFFQHTSEYYLEYELRKLL